MKDQAIQHLAFDVHQVTCEVSLRDASGTVVMRGAVPTEATAILRVVKGAGQRVQPSSSAAGPKQGRISFTPKLAGVRVRGVGFRRVYTKC